jgi:alpha/beta superfamily hydrolase
VHPHPLTLTATDGVTLDAEFAPADGTRRAAMVLCHPHPQHGGTMRSIVISALFDALPHAGVACLRFNFRGVEGSGGEHDHGDAEHLDVVAALAAVPGLVAAPGAEPADGAPLVLAGWSFGADMALSTPDPAVSAWLGIAPPLRYATDFDAVGHDPRPKRLALAEHDEFRPPASVEEAVAGWAATTTTVVGGASHFFVGRTDRLVELARGFVDELVAAR